MPKLKDCISSTDCDVVKPRFKNENGHPILISRRVAECLPDSDYKGGLNKIITDNGFSTGYVNVDDEGILININTMDDLAKKLKDGEK